jgi:hypothetical protein
MPGGLLEYCGGFVKFYRVGEIGFCERGDVGGTELSALASGMSARIRLGEKNSIVRLIA